MKNKTVYAIILAAGSGSRMCADITKQKMLLAGRSVISRAVGAFYGSEVIDGIVVVGRADELDYLREELSEYSSRITAIVAGGRTRFESARIGFESLPDGVDLVAIHDGARPLITQRVIKSVVDAAAELGAATDAAPIHDTVKLVGVDGVISATLDRSHLLLARTPQVFLADHYRRALSAAGDGEGFTDDNMMVEAIGVSVRAVVSAEPNPKITTPADLGYAEYLLNERGE